MGLTITYNTARLPITTGPPQLERITRNRSRLSGTMTFDSSYAFGGESVSTLAGYFPGGCESISIMSQKGYYFEYDNATSGSETIRVYDSAAPAVVYEEQQTVASNAITLDWPCAYIMAISTASATIKPVSSSAALGATTNCTFTCTKGERTTITFGSSVSGTVYVTYITQAWEDVIDNLVTETLTGATSANNTVYTLSNKAVAIQYVTLAGSAVTTLNAPMLNSADTAASGECVVTLENTATTEIKFIAADSVYAVRTSYIKQPATGLLKTRLVTKETPKTCGAASGAADTVQVLNYPCLLWSTANQMNVHDETNHYFISRDGSIGASEAKFLGNLTPRDTGTKTANMNCDYRTLEANEANGTAMTYACYIKGTWDEVPRRPLEVKNGKDLSAIVVDFEAVGLNA